MEAAGAFNSFRVVVSVARSSSCPHPQPPIGTFKQAYSFNLSMMELAELWDVQQLFPIFFRTKILQRLLAVERNN